MATKQAASIQRFIRKVVDQCRDHQTSDRDLLARFAEQRDEDAFAALVRRHSAMVRGVGQRVLHHHQDAEDVCQATFLLLARKAKAMPWRDSVANWLYAAAYHLALQTRDAAARRKARELKVKPKPAPDAMADITLRDLQSILDEELSRLPRKYGAPLLLCCLEGKSRDEAAQCLGWPLALVKSRLEDGREVLRRRLARRGLALSAVLAGVTLTSGAARAALPALLVRATSRAALQLLAGQTTAGVVSANVMALIKGGAQAMFLTKLKIATALLLAVGVVTIGIITLAQNALVTAQTKGPAQAGLPRAVPGDALPAGPLARLGATRWRHGGITGLVAFLPDGKSVVSVSNDQVFHVWEFPSGKEIRRFGPGVNAPLPPPVRFPRSELPVTLSADGKFLASHFDGAELLLYDVATGKQLATLPQRGGLSSVAFSPHNRHLATRNMIGDVTIWDWKAGKTECIKARHGLIIGEVPALTYAPDGTLLAMTANESGQNSTIKLVDPRKAEGQQVRTIEIDPPAYVSGVLFSPDSKLLACTDGSAVRLLDVASGKQIRQIRSPERGGVTMAFAKDGKSIVTRSYTRRPVREWDVDTGKELRNFGPVGTEDSRGHNFMLPRPALSPDGTMLAFAGIDHALHFLDLGSGKEVHAGKGNTVALSALTIAPDGKRLWTQGDGKAVRQWDWPTGRELEPILLSSDTWKAALSPDARYVASAPTASKAGQIIRIADGKHVGRIPPPQQLNEWDAYGPASMVFSPDGALLAMRWEQTQKLELYASPQGKLLHALDIAATQADMAVNGLACWPVMLFSLDRQLLAAYSRPGVLSFWDTTSGQKRADWPLSDSLPLAGIAFTPDSRALAVEKADGIIVLLELASGKQRRVFVARDGPRRTTRSAAPGAFFTPFALPSVNVAFSPRGDLLIVGAPDGSIHVWNVHSGAELAAFRGHTGVINAFAFTADGKTLASASADTSVLTWDLSPWASRPIPPRVLTHAELRTRWADLAGEDAQKAFSAMCDLAAAPAQAVPFLNQRLPPAPPLDVPRINRQLADLGDSLFKVRAKAIADLLQLDAQAVPLIDKALAARPPLEVQRRLQKIRSQLTGPLFLAHDKLRLSRALEVLERIGTQEARQLLERLAGGAPGALTTTSARAALQRLARTK